MWKFGLPLFLALCAFQAGAADNPFTRPSQRDSAIQSAMLAAQKAENDAKKHDSIGVDAITPEIEELLNSKAPGDEDLERYVGRINGKDVYFSESRSIYIYK